jgi:hypothetical protein
MGETGFEVGQRCGSNQECLHVFVSCTTGYCAMGRVCGTAAGLICVSICVLRLADALSVGVFLPLQATGWVWLIGYS